MIQATSPYSIERTLSSSSGSGSLYRDGIDDIDDEDPILSLEQQQSHSSAAAAATDDGDDSGDGPDNAVIIDIRTEKEGGGHHNNNNRKARRTAAAAAKKANNNKKPRKGKGKKSSSQQPYHHYDRSANNNNKRKRMIWIVGAIILLLMIAAGVVFAALYFTNTTAFFDDHQNRGQQQTNQDTNNSIEEDDNSNNNDAATDNEGAPTNRPSTTTPPSLSPSIFTLDHNASARPSTLHSTPPSLHPSMTLSASPSSSPTKMPTTLADTTTTFYAIGDVPYNSRQRIELQAQMASVPEDAEFVIHVGDLRKADDNEWCRRQDYANAATLLRLSHAPVFVILGDNDWTDCPNREEGLGYWNQELLNFDRRFWNHSFDVVTQPSRKENFSFIHKGTLFIGLNIVGGDVHDSSEWVTRLTEQAAWTLDLIRAYDPAALDNDAGSTSSGRVVLMGHADPRNGHNAFFIPLRNFIANELNNRLPILYINGDRHEWRLNEVFFNQPSFLRIMVTGGTDEPPLKLTIAPGKWVPNNNKTTEAFPFDRRLPVAS